MKLSDLATLNAERAARRPAVFVIDPSGQTERLVYGAGLQTDPLATRIAEQLRIGKSGMIEVEGKELFLTVHLPPVRLVVVGAVHISQALAPMAARLGLDMTIVDPRTAFATPERFPGVALVAQWPDEAIAARPLDRYTGVVLLTHDPKIDDPALIAALKEDCFYIGALGSRKTHARRLERMRAQGFDDETLARIHAPIGLDIGAVDPAEIAVAILGEVIAARHRKPLRREKDLAA